MLATALLMAVFAATDGGASPSLSFNDVKQGDFVRYQIDGQRTLDLWACARSPKAVTVAIQATLESPAPGCSTPLDGVLVDVPTARLQPSPELPQPQSTEERTINGAPADCGVWISPRMTHGPNTRAVRCIAPELVLGGGLVHFSYSLFTVRGQGDNYTVSLDAQGNRAGACPAWPRSPLNGWWRLSNFDESNEAWEVTARAGSAWVATVIQDLERTRSGPLLIDGVRFAVAGKPQENLDYLLDELIPRARALPSTGKCTQTTASVAGLQVPAVVHVESFEDRWGVKSTHTVTWAAANAIPNAPLWVRIQPLVDQWLKLDGGQKSTSRKRLEAFGAKRPQRP